MSIDMSVLLEVIAFETIFGRHLDPKCPIDANQFRKFKFPPMALRGGLTFRASLTQGALNASGSVKLFNRENIDDSEVCVMCSYLT